jgi:hypothetical protein
MFVRISTIEAEPGRIDDGIAVINEKVLPTLKGIDGFTAANFLADRATGKLMGIVFWDSEQAMEASADVVNPIRTTVAEAMGGKITSVESFELVAQSW